MDFELVYNFCAIMGPKRQVLCIPNLEERNTQGSFAQLNGGSVLLLFPHIQYAVHLLAMQDAKYAA